MAPAISVFNGSGGEFNGGSTTFPSSSAVLLCKLAICFCSASKRSLSLVLFFWHDGQNHSASGFVKVASSKLFIRIQKQWKSWLHSEQYIHSMFLLLLLSASFHCPHSPQISLFGMLEVMLSHSKNQMSVWCPDRLGSAIFHFYVVWPSLRAMKTHTLANLVRLVHEKLRLYWELLICLQLHLTAVNTNQLKAALILHWMRCYVASHRLWSHHPKM